MKIYNDFDLSAILWYKIGGKTKYLLQVESALDVSEAVDFIKKNDIERYFIIGKGSNLLFSDKYFDGAIIRFVQPHISSLKLISGERIYSFGGEVLDEVIKFSFQNNLTGFEWAGGLPGTVGAAIRGNVGAFGGEIKDSVEEVEVLKIVNSKLELEKLNREELKFGYRDSLVKHDRNLIVVSVTFKLKKSSKEDVEQARKIYFDNIAYREKNHPLEYPNCGSVFKNISEKRQVESVLKVFPDLGFQVAEKWYGKVSMGAIISKLGFSGFKVGNAQISTKHNNYIVNLGKATSKDVVSIINAIKKTFFETFGFEPEVEIEIFG